MNKKFFLKVSIVFMVIGLAFAFSACEDEEAEQPEEQVEYEIALIADDSLINDGGSSEVLWNAITEFAAGHGLSHKYYKATDSSDSAFIEAIDNAVEKGAKVIIADDSTVSDVIYDEQKKYADVKFILLNAEPYNEINGDVRIGENTVAITFATEQAGFLAGYTAVSEGYSRLGFIGENKDKNINNYGLGFARGANRAAREAGENVELKYYLCKGESATDEAEAKADDWFAKGTELIFTCGHKSENAVIESAEVNDGKVIGGMTDKVRISDTVIISAVENINLAVNDMLKEYVDNNFPGGEILVYDASNQGIGLEWKNNRLKTMDKDEYEDMFKALASGELQIRVDNVEDIRDMSLNYVTLVE